MKFYTYITNTYNELFFIKYYKITVEMAIIQPPTKYTHLTNI